MSSQNKCNNIFSSAILHVRETRHKLKGKKNIYYLLLIFQVSALFQDDSIGTTKIKYIVNKIYIVRPEKVTEMRDSFNVQ